MEVIYTPPWQSIEAIIGVSMQEDVDVIGISSLATDHLIVPDLMSALKKEGLDAVRVVVGGIIPQNEVQVLMDSGVSKVFGSGATRQEIVDTVGILAREAQEEKRQRVGFA
jgi:methylmalonyl-CoA mutase C-terminal domain/subunit